MQYYKVPASMQDHPCYKPNKPRRIPNGYYLIAHELLTPAEAKRINAPVEKLDYIAVKKTDTYNCFGARFLCENAKIIPAQIKPAEPMQQTTSATLPKAAHTTSAKTF